MKYAIEKGTFWKGYSLKETFAEHGSYSIRATAVARKTLQAVLDHPQGIAILPKASFSNPCPHLTPSNLAKLIACAERNP